MTVMVFVDKSTIHQEDHKYS